jgi:hypothetical protein
MGGIISKAVNHTVIFTDGHLVFGVYNKWPTL